MNRFKECIARGSAVALVVFVSAGALVAPAAVPRAWASSGPKTGASEAGKTTRAWGHDAAGVREPAQTWFLAEGSTGEGFETWVLVENNNVETTNVKLTFLTPKGRRDGPTVTLAPFTRKTVNVADTLPDEPEVSTVVESDHPVVVERAMYGKARDWAHDAAGVSTPAKTWYLAEGSTAESFETWVLVQNPTEGQAKVQLTYMTGNGRSDGPSFTLAPLSRKTVNVSESMPGTWAVSTTVTSDVPVVVERAMYGDGRSWAHDSAGVTEPANTWYLAEGSTAGGNETWVLVQNPLGVAAKVKLTYMTASGPVQGPSETLAPYSRKNFFVADAVPGTWDVSTTVESDSPVVVERSVYGPGRSWATGAAGITTPAQTWYLAEGSTGQGFETWVLVQNPTSTPAAVQLTYITDKGPTEGPSFTLAPFTRKSENVADTVPGRFEVSTIVHSDKGVVAERAVYGDRKSTIHGQTLMKGTIYQTEAYVITPGGSPDGVPTLMVMGGVHGDETAGYLTAERLTRAIVSKGKLVVLPHTNQAAISANTRYINKDLNRCFPGSEAGVAEDRLAWEIMELARNSHISLLLNLHTAVQYFLLDPGSALGQTVILDDSAIAPAATSAAAGANTSIADPVEKFSPLLKPIPASATYEVYYGQGKPAYGIEACEKLSLPERIRDELLVIKAFADQIGVRIDNWNELLQ